jgi:hypothetical protein
MYLIIILLIIILFIILVQNNIETFMDVCTEKPKMPNLDYNQRFGDILVYENAKSVGM